MSLKFKGKNPDKVRELVDSLKATITSQGDSFVNNEQTQALISMESLDAPRQAALSRDVDEIEATLKAAVQSLGFEAFDDTTADGMTRMQNALSAGAVAAMAAGNPVEFAKRAYNTAPRAEEGVNLVDPTMSGPAGRMDYRSQASLEAFDERELREHLPYSIVFNMFGSRQDELSEMFFPTTVVTPDQAGLDVCVSRMMVFNEVRHAISGKAINFNKRNLIEAAVDASVLADESTRLIPVRQPDDSNAEYFVPAAVVGTVLTDVSGFSVPTAPLLLGKEVDLIGISQFQPLIGAGIIDNTDSIDARISLEAIYLQVDPAAPAVKFNVSRLPRSGFNKTVEGNGREMNLQFGSRDLVIDKDSRAIDGSVVAAFAAIAAANYTVRLGIDVNGSANVETGNVKVYASPLTVDSITDENGNNVSMSGGAGAAIKADLEAFGFVGYDLRASRTNSNRRTRGLMLDTTYETDRYTIPLGAPLSVPAPTTSNRDAADLKALITASRVRNSNNAVTQLFNYADQLSAYVRGPKRAGQVPQVAGMGRYLVEPWFESHTLDMLKSINSIKSHEKAADVSAVLVNAIRDIAYRMLRDSRYQAALDAYTGGTGETPVLLIGTDQVLVRHLMTQGDTRTFGLAFDKFAIKSTLDKRFANKIVLTFGREKSDGPDPLSFGTHAWIPELTSTLQVTRNGAVIKESMVQPRTLHVNNLPIMAIIDVQNLSHVLADKIATPAAATDITNPYLDGLSYP